jgi:hypothetical protein
LPHGSTIYADAAYTDYEWEDLLAQGPPPFRGRFLQGEFASANDTNGKTPLPQAS